jgi:hypothetical protein
VTSHQNTETKNKKDQQKARGNRTVRNTESLEKEMRRKASRGKKDAYQRKSQDVVVLHTM